MPTEMELTLEQTQQGVSHEVSIHLKSPSHYPCILPEHQVKSFTMKKKSCFESTSTSSSRLFNDGGWRVPVPAGFTIKREDEYGFVIRPGFGWSNLKS
ncbi:hypothetical protein Tco_1041407 [Tanacetum coccineum]|uniref:Uncharacterized protein n=1 Tax=Tanacetum coccineum TaxID=301880 RepID=A0ABQ5GIB9_9ASTR